MSSSTELQQVWARAVDQVKRDVISPSLWRALERTVAVVWEEDNFVVGLSGMDGTMAGQLNTGENQRAIERALKQITGKGDLRFRVLEGTTVVDWEHAKERDAAALASRQQAVNRKVKEATAYGSWDEIYDQVSRLWASSEGRALPSGRGRFIDAALSLVEKGMDTMYPAEGKPDDLTERGLSRVIERVASYTQSDSALLSYLLFERRKSGGR